jgi:hypothetical protein
MLCVRVSASCLSIVVLCAVTFYGPFLHEHPAGELGRSAVIHAHLPQPERVPTSRENSIGYHHSHGKAVWLDGFTTTAPDSVQFFAVLSATFIMSGPERVEADSPWIVMPRAHSPPGLNSAAPRSPPSTLHA